MIEFTGMAHNILFAEMVDDKGNTVVTPIVEIKIGTKEKQFNKTYKENTLSFIVPLVDCKRIAEHFIEIEKGANETIKKLKSTRRKGKSDENK